jgi:dUTP pyrophosphatase
MGSFKIKFKKANGNGVLPIYANKTDAGMDLFSVDNVVVFPNRTAAISTGLIWEPEARYGSKVYMKIEGKSGLALKYGIGVLGGIIDEGYRSEIKVILINHSRDCFEVVPGMKIAQGIVYEIPFVELSWSDEINLNTERGANGFGSTGV